MKKLVLALAVALVALGSVVALAPASQAAARETQYGWAAHHRLASAYMGNGDLLLYAGHIRMRTIRYSCTVSSETRPTTTWHIRGTLNTAPRGYGGVRTVHFGRRSVDIDSLRCTARVTRWFPRGYQPSWND